IRSNDGLVALDLQPTDVADHAGCAVDFFRFNSGVKAMFTFVNIECHYDFFQGRIARPFANSVNGTFYLARPSHQAGQGVCHGESKIVMAMDTEDSLFGVWYFCDDVLDNIFKLPRHSEADRVGKIDS